PGANLGGDRRSPRVEGGESLQGKSVWERGPGARGRSPRAGGARQLESPARASRDWAGSGGEDPDPRPDRQTSLSRGSPGGGSPGPPGAAPHPGNGSEPGPGGLAKPRHHVDGRARIRLPRKPTAGSSRLRREVPGENPSGNRAPQGAPEPFPL